MLFEAEFTDAKTCEAVRHSFEQLAGFIKDFSPDLIIQFSPDHFHGFHYGNMPSFCIGAGANSCGDWRTQAGRLLVDEEFALTVLDAARRADFDIAVSFDMTVDHGFVQMWEAMWGEFNRYPIIPIFVNSIAPPLPTYRRARQLGEAIGRFAASTGKRILFAASGGLSHDPIVPQIQGASPELRDRLLGRAPVSAEQQERRERMVRKAARLLIEGKGSSRPLNPAWDREFLFALRTCNWDCIDAYTAEQVEATAGSGGNEVLCWVAAAAAAAASGALDVVQEDYLPIPGWIAGMAHFAARVA
jgi:2,3-dihydroxyphenylpropionate 1,2-dioxygenase